MPQAPLFLRPIAGGVVVTVLLVALAGCGLSSSQEAAQPAAPAPATAHPEAALIKRAAVPALMAAPRVMHDTAMPDRVEPSEHYQNLPENPVYSVAQQPVSTFSADVDTGSYANVRRFLN